MDFRTLGTWAPSSGPRIGLAFAGMWVSRGDRRPFQSQGGPGHHGGDFPNARLDGRPAIGALGDLASNGCCCHPGSGPMKVMHPAHGTSTKMAAASPSVAVVGSESHGLSRRGAGRRVQSSFTFLAEASLNL